MRVLLERPWTSKSFGLLARKDRQYTRPIVGNIVDLRVEDFIPHSLMADMLGVNIIGRLPDIVEINQIDRYFVSTFNDIDIVSRQKADILIATGRYLILPENPSSKYWKHSGAPWWEYSTVLDKYDGFIKAPRNPRSGEPSPEDIDEKLDLYEENRGQIEVISPAVLDKWSTSKITENYLDRLNRISIIQILD